ESNWRILRDKKRAESRAEWDILYSQKRHILSRYVSEENPEVSLLGCRRCKVLLGRGIDVLMLKAPKKLGSIGNDGPADHEPGMGPGVGCLVPKDPAGVVEEVSCVEARIGEVAVDLAAILVTAGPRHGIDLRSKVASLLGVPQQSRNLELLN